MLVKIGSVAVEIFGEIGRILPYHFKSWALIVELWMRVSARRWCISFQKTRAKNEDSQFWRLQKSPKNNWYHGNVSYEISINTSMKAEMLVKIGSVVAEIFSEIGRILPYRFKSTNFSHLNLWRYRTKVHHICTRCRGIISAITLLIHIAIFQSILKCQGAEMKVILQILPKIGYHGNVPWGIGKTGPDWQKFMQYTFHLVKKKSWKSVQYILS